MSKISNSYDAIFITEKPEIGTAIIKALKSNFTTIKKNVRTATVNNKSTLIIDFEGNPFRLQHPNEINPILNDWSKPQACLPVPEMPRLVAADGMQKHLDFTKKCCAKAGAIFIATDSDVEGEAIGQEIAAYCGVGHRAERILFMESLNESDVIAAIRNRKPLESTRPKWRAAQAKRYSDWYWQYLVRVHTANARLGLMGNGLHIKDPKQVISSGRVQSIVQLLISAHHKMREEYKPVRYFRITAESEVGTFEMLPPPPAIGDDRVRLNKQGIRLVTSEVDAKRVFSDLQAYNSGIIESILDSVDTEYPSNPFDATSLQSEAFKQFKMSPKWTMKVADRLRLSGFITYVRTDDSRLPESILRDGSLSSRLESAKLIGGLGPGLSLIHQNLLTKSPAYKPKCFSETVSGHHGIIPSENVPDFTRMDRTEILLYEMIVRQFVVSLMPPAVIHRRRIVMSIPVNDVLSNGKTIFTMTDNMAVDPGWKILSAEPPKQDWSADGLREGMHIAIDSFNFIGKESSAPPPMKIPDLLRQLKRPSLICSDQRTLSIIENARGIGTAATRDSIIEKVKHRKYSTEDDEGRLLPTLFGLAYINALHPELLDVAITAHIEQNMIHIEDAASDKEAIALRNRVLKDAHAFITHHVQAALEIYRRGHERP